MRSWELQNWYFSKSWLLTRLCRQAVLTAVHVYVCYTGGSSLASSLSSDTDSLWDFSEPLCLSGTSVFSSVKQDSWILVGAGQGCCGSPSIRTTSCSPPGHHPVHSKNSTFTCLPLCISRKICFVKRDLLLLKTSGVGYP